jgi:hypothetical protein
VACKGTLDQPEENLYFIVLEMAQDSAVRTVSEVSVLLTGNIGSYIGPATFGCSIENRGAGSEFMSQRTVNSMLEADNNTMHLVKQEVLVLLQTLARLVNETYRRSTFSKLTCLTQDTIHALNDSGDSSPPPSYVTCYCTPRRGERGLKLEPTSCSSDRHT